PDDLAELRRWERSSQLPAVLGQRARILLLAADGATNTEIAERVGVSRPTVIACRRRYLRRGLAGPPARPRPRRAVAPAGPRSCRPPSPRHHRGWGSPTGRPGCWPASSASAATP